ncbi:hypothetical protein C0J52_04153 [Blattella germanica]|nr:hypothetical protein C0J52_04153 [Blattella germanica]
MALRQMLVFLIIYWLNSPAPVQSELVDEELPPELRLLLEKEKWDVHGHPMGEQEGLTSDYVQGESQHDSNDAPKVWGNVLHHGRTSKEYDAVPSRSKLANLYREHIRFSSSNSPERKPVLMSMNPKFDLEKLEREPLNDIIRHHPARNPPSTISTLSRHTVNDPYHKESREASEEIYNRVLSSFNLHESSAYPTSVHTVRKLDYEKLERGRPADHKKRPAASKQSTSKQFEKSHRSELPRGLPHLHIMPIFAPGRHNPQQKSVYTIKVDKSRKPITSIFQLLK